MASSYTNIGMKVLMSPNCEVHFTGWRSNARELIQHGWNVSVDYNPYERTYSMWLYHKELRLNAVSPEPMKFSPIVYNHPSGFDMNSSPHGRHTMCIFNVCQVTGTQPNMHIGTDGRLHGSHMSNGFKVIDMRESLEVVDVDDFWRNGMFKFRTTTDQMIVDNADMEVVDMLEAIVSKQAPRQKELREKARKEAKREVVVDSSISFLKLG